MKQKSRVKSLNLFNIALTVSYMNYLILFYIIQLGTSFCNYMFIVFYHYDCLAPMLWSLILNSLLQQLEASYYIQAYADYRVIMITGKFRRRRECVDGVQNLNGGVKFSAVGTSLAYSGRNGIKCHIVSWYVLLVSCAMNTPEEILNILLEMSGFPVW